MNKEEYIKEGRKLYERYLKGDKSNYIMNNKYVKWRIGMNKVNEMINDAVKYKMKDKNKNYYSKWKMRK